MIKNKLKKKSSASMFNTEHLSLCQMNHKYVRLKSNYNLNHK